MLFVVSLALVQQARADTTSIMAFAPSVGYRGTLVRIEGSGLDAVTGIRFGAADAAFTVESNSVLHATVPRGATTGPIILDTAQGQVASGQEFTAQANVIVVVTDDQRWDALRFPTIRSELIGKGVTFEQAFAPTPLCCPSRASILTGRFSHSTGVYKNRPPQGGFETFTAGGWDASTFATWLDDVGYTTAFVGKYLNGYDPADISYVPPGWDHWVAFSLASASGGGDSGGYFDYTLSVDGTAVPYGSDPADYSTDVLGGYAADLITAAPANAPLLLYFAPRAPHKPSTPAPRHASAFTSLVPLSSPNINEADVSDKPSHIRSLPVLTWKQIKSAETVRRRHHRSLLAVDEAVATILDRLAETDRLLDTMIVFTSDNGIAFGEHRWRGKEVPYEESIRVPLVLRYDALTGGIPSASHRLAMNVDVAATAAEAAGVSPLELDGESLVGSLDGSATTTRAHVLLEHARTSVEGVPIPAYCGVRTSAWKYVRYADGQEELYDLVADPFELENLAAHPEHAELKAELMDRTRALCSPTPPKYGPF
jgi:N-acetylglucosamine-6-sulfatase